MQFFTIVEDANVILLSKGVYKQAKVYSRGGRFYAGHGSGFIRLNKDCSTTVPAIRWLEVEGAEIK